ncbi:MAG: YggT family protein [Candidatus Omnitrophica bacterium]|nr:YggT family protein [Candidatus Omnitrophota bacterium]MCM8831380.1 YggT family protein [Candidatus Omnitrophota bacterium]
MFIISNFLIALAKVLELTLSMLWWLILIRAIISWVNPDPYNPIVLFLQKTTEPVLYPIRRFLPFTLKYGIDISPIIAFLLITFAKYFIVQTILDIAGKLR